MGKAPWRLATSGCGEQSLWTQDAQISKEEVSVAHITLQGTFQTMERGIWGPEKALGSVLPSPWGRGGFRRAAW